jgi:hypothetical protein
MALVDRLDSYDRLVEIGIGTRPSVARELSHRGSTVCGVDIHDRSISCVRFVQDDVTDPTHELYADADAVYALRLPPDLHRPTWDLAREHDAALFFTTLGLEPPTVPVVPEPLHGTTLYRVREDSPTPERY